MEKRQIMQLKALGHLNGHGKIMLDPTTPDSRKNSKWYKNLNVKKKNSTLQVM